MSDVAGNNAAALRELVLRGLARNRIPGLHFPGNFLALERRRFDRDAVSIALPRGAHIEDGKGRVGLSAVMLLVDVTLATAMRPFLAPGVRTATVSMQVNFTGVPAVGPLLCSARCLGFSHDAVLPQAICRGELTSGSEIVCYCSGSFVQLDTPANVTLAPTAWEVEPVSDPPPLEARSLDQPERKILRHADRRLSALPPDEAFVNRFWGGDVHAADGKARSRLMLGPHVNNRVGNAQGGVMMAHAAVTAAHAVPRHRLIESIAAWFISPGAGTALRLRSETIQQGRSLAVVRTQVFAPGRKRVLEVISNHAVAKPA